MQTRVRSRVLQFEALEGRELLAGNVNISSAFGIYFITGDAASNQVQIEVAGSGQIKAFSVDGTTTINNQKVGADGLVVGTVGFRPPLFFASMGAGDDLLLMNDLGAQNIRGIIAQGGTGNDSLVVNGFAHGNKIIALLGDDGADTMQVRDSAANLLAMVGGDGQDLMNIRNSAAGTLVMHGQADSAFINAIDVVVAGSTSISNDGATTASIVDSEFGGPFSLKTGAAGDSVTLGAFNIGANAFHGEFFVDTGAGADTFTVTGDPGEVHTFEGLTVAELGAGDDVANLDHMAVTSNAPGSRINAAGQLAKDVLNRGDGLSLGNLALQNFEETNSV